MKHCRWIPRLLAVAALAVAAGGVGVRAAEGPILLDPRSGARAGLELGARATHLVFFAAWCPPCVEELPRLAELEARFGAEGYRLFLVAVKTRQDAERLASFVAERQPPGELRFDVDGAAEKHWKADRLPTHVVLDPTGKELARAGSLSPELLALIERTIGARGPSPERPR